MSTAPTIAMPPSVPSIPERKRWTVTEYHRLATQGAFAGRRTFLIEGEIYEMAPGDPPHATSTTTTADAVRAAFGPSYYVRVQLPLVLGLSTDPEPDVAVVAGVPRDHRDVHPNSAALVVEVSDSTRT